LFYWRPEELLQNVIVVFCLVCGVIVALSVFYGVYKRIAGKPKFLQGRHPSLKILSLLIRVLHFSYFGLSFAAINQIYHGSDDFATILAFFIAITVTMGLPTTYLTVLVVYFIKEAHRLPTVRVGDVIPENAKLDIPARLRLVFASIFGDFHMRRTWFSLVILARMFLVSIFLVMMSSYPGLQTSLLLAVHAIYFVLLASKPYRSSIAQKADWMMCVIDIITTVIPLLLLTHPDLEINSQWIQWILIALNAIVIALYVLYGASLLKGHVARLMTTVVRRGPSQGRSVIARRYSGDSVYCASEVGGADFYPAECLVLQVPPTSTTNVETAAIAQKMDDESLAPVAPPAEVSQKNQNRSPSAPPAVVECTVVSADDYMDDDEPTNTPTNSVPMASPPAENQASTRAVVMVPTAAPVVAQPHKA